MSGIGPDIVEFLRSARKADSEALVYASGPTERTFTLEKGPYLYKYTSKLGAPMVERESISGGERELVQINFIGGLDSPMPFEDIYRFLLEARFSETESGLLFPGHYETKNSPVLRYANTGSEELVFIHDQPVFKSVFQVISH